MSQKLSCRVALAVVLAAVTLLGRAAPVNAQVRTQAVRWFDTSRYASERSAIDAIRTRSFPYLGSNYEVLYPAAPSYNCIAWSLGLTTQWVWPGTSVAAFDRLNARFGYRRMARPNYRLQAGIEKIVLYGKMVNGKFQATHQARQMRDGTWTSKLGRMPLIRHAIPDSLTGPDYGRPVAVYYRWR